MVQQTYKTDIPWMPELPSHWKLMRGKNIFVEKSIKNCPNEPLLAASQKQGVVLKSLLEQKSMEAIGNFESFKLVEKDDFVISLRSFEGGLEIAHFRGIISPVYNVFNFREPDKFEKSYFKHLFKSIMFIQELNVYKKGIRDGQSISYKEFANIIFPIPPRQEQIAIANYLDKKSKKIKHFIQKKQAFIELLKEQRQAIISRAVTKGINPNVTLKDSGIEWLGDIPEHWELRKLRYCGQCQNGLNKGGEFFGKGFPFFGYGDIYNNEILPEIPSGLVESTEEDQANCSVEKGDVFFTRTSEIVDEIAIASTCHETIPNATFSGFLIRFRPTANLLYEGYSTYYFRNELLREYFVKEMNIITRASMSQDLLKSLPIVLPPIEEQVMIYKYIKTETAKIDQAIAKAEKEIELIKEYREAMIAETVLGKLHHKIMGNRSEIPNSSEEPMPQLTN